MTDIKQAIAELRMDAYYYHFERTGNEAIDKVLSAIAHAGKAYHNTADWNDECDYTPKGLVGKTPVEWIQNAAKDAAALDRLASSVEGGTVDSDKQLEEVLWLRYAVNTTATALTAACDALDGLMGDTDLVEDDSPEFIACQNGRLIAKNAFESICSTSPTPDLTARIEAAAEEIKKAFNTWEASVLTVAASKGTGITIIGGVSRDDITAILTRHIQGGR